MPQQDTTQTKEKILSHLRLNGPSLPIHIAKKIDTSILFASAFLSELLSENKLKLSHMRVGSSPLYLLPGQEPQLEKFAEHLKSKEKEAFLLLKNKKILRDKSQEPAIRVALRSIKDFAIPFKTNSEEIYWRYLTTPKPSPQKEKRSLPPLPKQKTPDTLKIFESEEKKEPTKEVTKEIKKKVKRKTSNKANEKFFNDVKEFLLKENIELIDIISFSKEDLILKVQASEKEHLLIALKKRRVSDTDMIKANKKAREMGLPYILLSKGEPSKKFSETIDAAKNLSDIKKII